MNYLRGALNAASQYYKDLPPINPATLTGAIDVIVIERTTENGDIELVCSPFHVRFGKWQVLRPAEKQVTVLVNGEPIPFNMKIGDAGEAFFVFETEEDVPEDLITSPLLQPLQDTDLLEPQADESGRFGARQDKPSTPPPQLPHLPKAPHEPEFLDLNAPQDSHKAPTSQVVHSPQPEVSRTSSISSTVSTKINDLKHTSQDAPLSTIKSTAAAMRDFATTSIPRIVRTSTTNSAPDDGHTSPEDAGDKILPASEDIHPPDVTYHRGTVCFASISLFKSVEFRCADVVLDLSGYHSRGPSERTVTGEDKWDEQSDFKEFGAPSPETSRTPTPDSSEELPGPRPPRATSAPPEYGAPSSPPPEYSWDWGAFPQRSPADGTFPRDRLQQRLKPSSSNIPRSRSPIPETAGGKLEADAEDPFKVWLDFEGQRLSFELSLCGENGNVDSNRNLNDDPLQRAKRFDAKRIPFQTLLNDESVLRSEDLVVRWDDESENSPLMSALVKWRTLTEAERALKIPESISSPTTITASPTTLTHAPKPAVRSRTWSRWWSRSYATDDVQPKVQSMSTPASASASVDKLVPLTVPIRSATPDVIEQPLPLSSVPFPKQVSAPSPPHYGKKHAKTLRLTSDQLKSLNLKKGANSITFSLSATGQVACTARIFVWDSSDQVVVSDIDGTITNADPEIPRSDALGHVFTLIGRDWTHLGVAKLYTDICKNGYKVMYLTSRAIGQADSTRDYLKGINQNNYQLPEGPVIMSPDRLLTSLHREVIMRKPEVFKMACLKDIQRLFGGISHNPFYAGFGNRITDALSYRSVDIPSARIFTIDSSGEVKMELLELAGYKSSYIHMTDLVDQMFPPINRKWTPEYTDFNYWRTPIPELELPELVPTPPSPSLSASARSDTSMQSTFSRLRHFSLGRSSRAQSPDRVSSLSSNGTSKDTPQDTLYTTNNNNKHIRSAASLDRFGSFLPNQDEIVFVPNDWNANRQPKRRPGSMPGSLDLTPGLQDPRWLEDEEGDSGDEGSGNDEPESDHDGYTEDQGAEQTFDDDLIATGEMENVPPNEPNELGKRASFLFTSLEDKAPSSSRKVHIRRLVDLLYICIHKQDWNKAGRAWVILTQCSEFNWQSVWQFGIIFASSLSRRNENVTASADSRSLEYLRIAMLRLPLKRVDILQEIVVQLINQEQYRQALEELEL
ncbi:hypothetical protein Clacol_001383 [Clathrus columnatus]|uniref:phosphatidate phosphatase n=1 Tax=Clathrus columnatus TaxID=1419009 RepID=A0AAV5A3G6_9AGAM|nr:hypothetical protein Clacol_001383 [Clathrus columnatus]